MSKLFLYTVEYLWRFILLKELLQEADKWLYDYDKKTEKIILNGGEKIQELQKKVNIEVISYGFSY